MIRWFIFLVAVAFCFQSYAQESSFIRVQFIYGSKPLKKYKSSEQKWFGGVLGGHVGIEDEDGKFYSFEKNGKLKIFNSKPNNSVYKIETDTQFWNIMKTNEDSLKTTTVVIPVTPEQKQKFDSVTTAYIKQVPYSYALFGMRCGASTYDILSRIGILPHYREFKTYMKIFYPRRLRKRLLNKAKKNHWTVIRKEGTPKRKWEKDV